MSAWGRETGIGRDRDRGREWNGSCLAPLEGEEKKKRRKEKKSHFLKRCPSVHRASCIGRALSETGVRQWRLN